MNTRQNPYLEDQLEDRAVIVRPTEGEVLEGGGSKITFKVTSAISHDQLGVYQIELAPKTVGAQLHYHRFMDETFIVQEGTLTVQHGAEEVAAEAGAVVYVPRFTPHGFANHSDRRVSLTLIFNPAQKREGFFYGLMEILRHPPLDTEAFLALYNKYDSHPVDRSRIGPRPSER
jgi:quercetin dioxygenase-like cupin family protein